jgi:8-oxo-dGTP diphosphatase
MILRPQRFYSNKRLLLREIKVVAGILQKNGEVLIAQRSESHHEGKWEFPGGKVDADETSEVALIRELEEELCLDCSKLEFYSETSVDLNDKRIFLLTYLVHEFSGQERNKVHAQLKWVKLRDLSDYAFLEADIPVVEKLIISC